MRKSSILLAASVLMMFGAAAAHAGVSDYNNASLYPARVSAIHFDNTMDANTPVVWGNWIVGFGKDLPTAKWSRGDDYTLVDIGDLYCVNNAADNDDHLCEFEIQFFDNGGQPNCSVDDLDESYVIDLYTINCPTSIDFAQ